ncbi:MAG: TonB-dependent siderophore receptor [Pacificimonas sp.]
MTFRLLASTALIATAVPTIAIAEVSDAGGNPAVASGAIAAAATAPTGPTSYAPEAITVTGIRENYLSIDGTTAMKTPTSIIETPQTLSVLTRDQLDDQNFRQLNEALRFVAGVSLETGEGHRDEIFIRGQESTADFYLNGLRDDAQYYRSLYNIERIEILKGANALIFGRGGGGGVVNRVSKTADVDDMFVDANGSVNTFGGFALAGDANAPVGDSVALRVNGTYEEFDNHRDEYEGRFVGISPTVTFQPGPDTRIVVGYSYDDDERVTDRGIPALDGRPLRGFDETFFGDPEVNDARAKVHILRGRVDQALTSTLSVNASAHYANYDKQYGNVLPRGTDGTSVELSGYRDFLDRENVILQGNLVWDGQLGGFDSMFLAGVEYTSQDTSNSRENVEFLVDGELSSRATVPLAETIFVPPTSFTDPVRDRRSDLSVFSAYVQNQADFGIVTIVGGVRYERFDLETDDLINDFDANRVDDRWSPRGALIVKPSEALSIYASYAESFLPQSGDQFLVLTPASNSFAPERFENIEAGVKWAPKDDLLVTASIFELERRNGRATDPNDPTLVVLTGRSRVQGAELQLAGDILPNWHVNAGYTYLDGEIRSEVGGAPAGTTLQQVPDHHIAAFTRYDFTDRLGFGAGIVHQSDQFASLSNDVVLPSYTRVDAAVYYDLTKDIALQANIENLFDEDYFPSAHGDNNIQPALPLTATFTARVRF